jgi:DNA-binding CsgD family transcriptional regulator
MLGMPRLQSTDHESDWTAPAEVEPESERMRRLAIAADQRAAAAAEPCPGSILWQELAHARWSLVDAFEAGGRRYLIARSADRERERCLAIDTLDRIIMAERATGASLKVIASEVGLSISTVARRLRLAMQRLGLRNAADLAALFRAATR